MMRLGTGMAGWGMAGMMIASAVFLSLVVLGVLALMRYSGAHRPSSSVHQVSPQQLLAQRFALGEIDEDEYAQRSNVLSDSAVV
jgi:putative membrane protein